MRRTMSIASLLVLSLCGMVAGVWGAETASQEEDYYELSRLLVDTLDEVERNYVKDVSRRELVEAAIRGILSELDPYSSYISPEEMRSFRTSVESQFGGIGIQIAVRFGQLTVLSPLVGTPAYRAGIMAGDRIVKINGQSTKGVGIDEAIKKLKGKAGTEVTLTVVHAGESEEEKITVTREIVRVETVMGDHRRPDDSWEFMLDPDRRIGYIRISAFSRTTADELRKALDDLKARDMHGLVLDLRFNPGGLLNSAIEVSDLFLAHGTIVSTEGRNSPYRQWEAHKAGTYEGFPLVVLANHFSASAAEIVSACLQDHHRAVIMGERTFGKGSVQNVIELEREPGEPQARSALKLTTASYMRPSGAKIHRFEDEDEDDPWGVKPDPGYELKLTDAEIFAVLQDRRQRDIVRPKKEGRSAEGTSPEAPSGAETEVANRSGFTDPHLKMALDYLTTELARADAAGPEKGNGSGRPGANKAQ